MGRDAARRPQLRPSGPLRDGDLGRRHRPLGPARRSFSACSLADSLGRYREAIPAYGSGGFTSYTEPSCRPIRRLGGARLPRVKIRWAGAGEPTPTARRRPRGDRRRGRAVGRRQRRLRPGGAARWPSLRRAGRRPTSRSPFPPTISTACAAARPHPAGIESPPANTPGTPFDLDGSRGCVDVLQADVTRCGGITSLPARRRLCRAHNLPLSAHCAPQVSAHLCCAMERAVHLEYFHDHERIERCSSRAPPPDRRPARPDPGRAGLGIELSGTRPSVPGSMPF